MARPAGATETAAAAAATAAATTVAPEATAGPAKGESR
jgi:hypothetical protein